MNRVPRLCFTNEFNWTVICISYFTFLQKHLWRISWSLWVRFRSVGWFNCCQTASVMNAKQRTSASWKSATQRKSKTLLSLFRVGVSAWKQSLNLHFTSPSGVSVLPLFFALHQLLFQVQSVHFHSLSLSPEQTSHSSQHLSSPDSYIHPSHLRWADGERGRKREEEGRKWDIALRPSLCRRSCCDALAVRGWVVLTFTMNYQWIDCVLPTNGEPSQRVGSNIFKLLLEKCVWPVMLMQCDVCTAQMCVWGIHIKNL